MRETNAKGLEICLDSGRQICLQEYKLELISNSVVHNLWGCQHVDWCYSAS
jgi:hypothetical protein